MEKRVCDPCYQPSGLELGRLARLSFLAKIIPLGAWARGPGLRCLVILGLNHYLGRIVLPLAMRHEERLHRLMNLLRRLR